MAIIFCGWFSMSISKGDEKVFFYLALLLSMGNVRWVTAPLSVARRWGRDEGRAGKLSTGCAASNKWLWIEASGMEARQGGVCSTSSGFISSRLRS
jgi:hypothetical protein